MSISPNANPICTMLENALESGLNDLNTAIKFQSMIKSQVNNLIGTSDLNTAINAIPDMNFALNSAHINAILSSCPGIFPNVPAINFAMAKGLKDYLKTLSKSPLSQINSMIKSLDDYMKPIHTLADTLFNYLTCMRNICGYVDNFETKWQEITNLKSTLNLDADGKPQIVDNTVRSITTSYETKINSMKNAIKQFS